MSPDRAAREITGKVLKIGRHRLLIREALPRNQADNARWLETKPLFGDNPVDAYVASYRGSYLLFIRTAPDTCVRINAAVTTNGTQLLKRPGQVTGHIGIDQEKTGDVTFDGQTLSISWHRRPRTIVRRKH